MITAPGEGVDSGGSETTRVEREGTESTGQRDSIWEAGGRMETEGGRKERGLQPDQPPSRGCRVETAIPPTTPGGTQGRVGNYNPTHLPPTGLHAPSHSPTRGMAPIPQEETLNPRPLDSEPLTRQGDGPHATGGDEAQRQQGEPDHHEPAGVPCGWVGWATGRAGGWWTVWQWRGIG